ncbi:ABC transporter permease [Neptuniibacter caesariensis]|uniref:Permease, putative n=1 Tax=Neptuniibacter caesariensis TaxID=207954 RepID=A0A7U8GRA3_NEPCE|nr:FtsX-like permease family protein [Neptuniibacter caesariensis]EAR61152.1 permease, putative [Oceanospirillum sp. MED92] [Neptuniibacter caesariensis]
MTHSPIFKLAAQQGLSNLKLSEWRALIIALMLAIMVASLMAVLGDRIERTLMRQGSAILGGDLVLSNSRPLSVNAAELATRFDLKVNEVTQLATMANSDENFLLVTIRALSAPYPRGNIALEQPYALPLPKPGEAWAEAGVFERMNLQVGDRLTLGNTAFVLSHKIESAPDRGRGFISFNPQLIINANELQNTGLIGPGARMQYRQLYAGSEEAIKRLEQQLQTNTATGERITTLRSDEGQQNSALTKASSYLRLGALFSIFIAAMTIFLSLRRFTQSQNKRAALLKTLGMNNQQLLRLYLLQLAYAWCFCTLSGVLLALALEQGGLALLSGLIPQPVPEASLGAYFSGPLLGLAILVCLGLPTLFRLQRSNPMQLLQARPAKLTWGGNLPYILAFLCLLLLTSWYLNSLLLTLSLSVILLIIGSTLGVLGAHIARFLCQRFASIHPLGNLLMSRVNQQQRWYRIQIPVICLLFSLLSINTIALNDLLNRWQAQLPTDTPDHFLINIQDWEKDDVETLLEKHQVDDHLWPIYRGRLVKVNDLPLADTMTPEQLAQPSLRRELNLTSSISMPSHNKLLSGNWATENSVSIEQEEAEELGLELGDKVSFDVGGQEVSAKITSIRAVKWDTFQPNFYFIFSPDTVKDLTASYMTSFHLGANSAEVGRELIQQFPTITLIDVRQILDQLQQLLSKLSLLSGLLMLLTTASGVILLYVTLTQELEQRKYENALLQTLGASKRQCMQLDRLEMALVGGLSGLLAVLIIELSLWPIHKLLINLEPSLHPELWITLPLTGFGLFFLISLVSHRQQSMPQSYNTLTSR